MSNLHTPIPIGYMYTPELSPDSSEGLRMAADLSVNALHLMVDGISAARLGALHQGTTIGSLRGPDTGISKYDIAVPTGIIGAEEVVAEIGIAVEQRWRMLGAKMHQLWGKSPSGLCIPDFRVSLEELRGRHSQQLTQSAS
jgi:hypothetical protein